MKPLLRPVRDATIRFMGALRHRLNWGAMFVLCTVAATGLLSAGTITYTHDPVGRLVSADYGAGTTISYAYDNAGNLVQFSQPSPGLAPGPIVNNEFTLSWPAAPAGFVLEMSATLGPAAVWQPVTIAATPAGNQYVVRLPLAGHTTFFRLHKP